MTYLKIFNIAIVATLLISCSNKSKNLADASSGNMKDYENSEVNGVTQALPIIMVFPGDENLKNFQSLSNTNIEGVSFVIRDYKKYLQKDDRFTRIASTIQSSFIDDSYPLQDFEQSLKQLDNRQATDIADDIQQDAKTLLLQSVNPDLILELNYHLEGDKSVNFSGKNKNKEKSISYTLSAIDAYTNKVVGTITKSNLKGTSTTETIQNSLKETLPELKKDIRNYFSDLQTRGREVTLRIKVGSDSNQNLSDESIEGDTYADYIIDYVKKHTVKGAYKLQTNTANELYFVNVRIPMVSEDGTQYGVYDWARDLAKAMRKDLGIKVSNQSQGLGEIVLSMDGMN